jgi:hypothetical protein
VHPKAPITGGSEDCADWSRSVLPVPVTLCPGLCCREEVAFMHRLTNFVAKKEGIGGSSAAENKGFT